MYRITYVHKNESTENPLYVPGDADYCLTTATLDLECGKSGELVVSLPDINPAKEDILCLTDEVIVYRDSEELWRGRPVTLQMDFDRTGTLTCEGILSYLYDTAFPPFEFEGSPKEFLQMVLDNHNSQVDSLKQFQMGDVTVEDNNDYINRSSIYYDKSLNVLVEKLIEDSLGGYFRVRIENGVRYLDYLESYNTQATQMVQFGENILDIAEEIEYSDLATVILPLGAKLKDDEGMDTDEYTTIESVNGGSVYYADEAAVNTYGWIVVIAEWSDVTVPDNLLTKAKNYLAQVTSAISSFTVNAIDLSLISEEEPIKLGDYVWIRSTPHGINQYIELTEQHIDILYPENDVLSFGVDTATLTGSQKATDRAVQSALGSLEQHVTHLSADVIDAVYANIETIVAGTINADYIYAICEEVGFLTADQIDAQYIRTDELEADIANIGVLTADSAIIVDLVAQVATIQNAYVDFETVETLLANYATIADLSAIYASIDVLEAGYAKIEELEAAVANIDSLTASVANINYLLSGYTSTGDLTAIHITTENAVIDSEVVMNLVAEDAILGTLMAGVIYTDYVTIMSSDGNYINTGSTEQFLDENGTIRIQIGMDASGTYNFYIAGEDGELLWDALGLTEEGLTANGAIVKDAAVADDANISGYKLNIEEICSIINSDGSYTFDAATITIDGQGLDAWYVEINSAIEGLEGMTTEGLKSITRYYAYWDSDTEAPPDDENLTPAICGEAICGLTICGKTDGTLWQIEPIAAQESLYRWCKLLGEYVDGHTEWGLPYCLDDGYERSQTQVLQTELSVVQGQIEAKVWEDDIIAYVDPIYGELTIINDEYATITVELGNISLSLGNLTTTVYEVQDVANAASSAANEARSTAEAAQSAAQTAQEAATQAASDAADAQSTADKAAADAAAAAQNATDAQTAADEAQAAAEAAQAEYDELKKQADATDEELEAAQKKLDEAQAAADEAQNAADQAAKDAADAAKLAEDAQTAADDAQKAADAAQSTADQAVEDAAAAQAAAAAATDLAKAVQDELGNVSLTVETMETNITEITEELGKITETVENVTQTILTLGDDIADIEARLAALDGLTNMTPWFCLWGSGTDTPPDDDEITPAICGEAVCGLTICGVTDGSFWQETEPEAVDGLYRWIKWYLEFENEESNRWTNAYCLDDTYTRRQISIVSDQYATLTIELDSIRQEVGDVQTVVTENYTYLSEQIATLEVTTNSISGTIIDLTETVQTVFNEVTGIQEQVIAIDSQVTSIIADTDGIKMDVENLQADVTTIGTSLDEIVSRIESLDGLQEWIPYWCLWDSGTEAPPDDEDLTPAICGEATCGLTVCGVTDGILWKEDEPPTQDGLYEWVKIKLIYQNGDIEWWGPYCISDVYVRAQIDATWAQLNVLNDRITAQVAELHETIDGDYESLSLAISNVEQTAYQIQSTVESLEIELGESVSDLQSQITQTATDIRAEVTAVQNGLTQAVADFELGIQETQDGIVSFINASADVITLTGDRISISSNYFTLTEDGQITATKGYIGGWTIGTSSLYNNCDSLTSTTNGIYLGTDGIRNYNSGDYLNITSGYVENGNSEGSYARLYSGSLRLAYQGTLLGAYGTTYWVDDSSKKGLTINLEYAADYIAFGRKSSSSATVYTAAYLINWNVGSTAEGYSERHIFYGTARFTDYLYTNRIYPGSSNDTYYITSQSISSTLRGIYTNGTFATGDAVYIGNTLYGSYGTYMLNVNGASYLSGTLTVTGAVSLSSTLAVSGTSTLTGAVTTGSTITASGDIYAGTSSTTSARYVYAQNSYGSVALIASYDSTRRRGLFDATNGVYIAYWDNSSSSYVFGWSNYVTSIAGSSITMSAAVSLSSTLSVSGTSALTGAVTTGSTITASGNVYAGTTSTTSARYVYAQNSYGTIVIGVNSSSTGNRGLGDMTDGFSAYYAYWSGTNSRYVFGNSYFPTFIQGSTISGLNAIATLAEYDVDDISTLAAANFRDPNHEIITHVNAHTYKVDGKKHLGLTVNELETAMKDAGMDPDEYDITDRIMDEDGNEHGAIRYDELIPMLFSEIQSLNERVAALEN